MKAALVKGIDEPGRNPYQAFRPFNLTVPSSDSSYFCQQPPSPPVCTLIFPTVPAGKRLVVENVTGFVAAIAPGFPIPLTFSASNPGGGTIQAIPLQLLPGVEPGNIFRYGANAALKNYIEGGHQPVILVSVSGSPGQLAHGALSVAGYLIDLGQ
ncbi:MAG: hypothetical protein ACRD8O_10385 [Bryobacteraceae bacterium]